MNRAALTTVPDRRMIGGGRYTNEETAAHIRSAADQLISSLGLSGTLRWCRDQGWGIFHAKSVVAKAQALIAAENTETIDQSRARMTAWLEHEIRDAEQAVMITRKGEAVTVKDRRAIAAYAHLLVTLRGLNVSTVQHVGAGARPLRDLTTAELLAQEQELAQVIADRAVSVDGTVLTDDGGPIPSTEKTSVELDANGSQVTVEAAVAPAWWALAVRGGRTWLDRVRDCGTPDGTPSPGVDGAENQYPLTSVGG